MKIWWKQQEMLFAILIFFLLLISHLLRMEADRSLSEHSMHSLFLKNGIKYTYLQHSLIPFLLLFGSPLVILLAVNGWLIPVYSSHPQKWWIFAGAALASWLLLTLSFSIQHYFKFAYLINIISPSALANEATRKGILAGGITMSFYSIYLISRESITHWLMRDRPGNAFRIMVCNRITGTVFIYFFILFLSGIFNLVTSDGPAIIYVFVVLPALILIFINAYALFPYREKYRPSPKKILIRLTIAPVAFSFTGWFFYSIGSSTFNPALFPALFLLLMVLTTPLSWLFYQMQREKISTLLQLEKKLGHTTADLAFLRSQINPHFLFNTLNTLYGTSLQENAHRTASGIQKLGDMMRFMLHENHQDKIPVTRELDYMKDYISLQSLRIAASDNIRIETSIETTLCDHLIAPMLLIPFVENAFKHGIRLMTPSYIMIKFFCTQQGIQLDVVNSIHTKVSSPDEAHSGIGLENVKQRLQLIYPGKHSLIIQKDDAAFQVRLQINLS